MKYRNVFSPLIVKSRNLLHVCSNCRDKDRYNPGECDHGPDGKLKPANPESQSEHVLNDFGWGISAGRVRYIGFQSELNEA